VIAIKLIAIFLQLGIILSAYVVYRLSTF